MSVIDNGIGIKKEDQSNLFQLFGFIDQTKELNAKGIGLGLHICKQITKELGGDIFCVSEWEKGTRFTFFVALNESELGRESVQRCRNPMQQRIFSKVSLVVNCTKKLRSPLIRRQTKN